MSSLTNCRLCHSNQLDQVLDLGTITFTGIFPSSPDQDVPTGSLRLVLCGECGLVQLADSFSPAVLYGDSYGYRSGLNASMTEHLNRTVRRLESRSALKSGDVVLDIGANDGSLLKAYSTKGLQRIAVDPTINKFRSFYSDDVICVPDFFSAEKFERVSKASAKVVTSIAMFYDLEDPVQFARDVHRVLAEDGLWHFEQSYMPWMLRSGAYDTICHEHLEYYSLTNISQILQMADFQLIDVATNEVNGGSISVTAAKASANFKSNAVIGDWLIRQESKSRVHDVETWHRFGERISESQSELLDLLTSIKRSGGTVAGLGASTKGNVLLQTTGIGKDLLDTIGDVNADKFGRFLPGTGIPIESEEEVISRSPDFLLILPWHFRGTFMSNLSEYLSRGGRLILPLPNIEISGY